MSDIDDRIVEALLGPELTRKLDEYIAREEAQNPCGKRLTRLEVVKGSVGAFLCFAQLGFEQHRAKAQKVQEVRKLAAQGLSVGKIGEQLHMGQATVRRLMRLDEPGVSGPLQ